MERGWHCFSSGVVEWSDISSGDEVSDIGSFCKGLSYSIRREILYETGLTPEADGYEIIPYAFARELKRPGKPQFFFLLRFTRMTAQEVIDSIDRNLEAGKIREMTEYAIAHPGFSTARFLKRIRGRSEAAKRRFWVTGSYADRTVNSEFLHDFSENGHEGDGPTYELFGALYILEMVYRMGRLNWSSP